MTVNVKLLKKVRKLIAEEPRRLDMTMWGFQWSKESLRHNRNLPACGTTACLAGHILIAAAKDAKGVKKLFHRNGAMRVNFDTSTISERAAKLIGVRYNECPFGEIDWRAPEVLAWIDRQIDAAR